MNCFDCSPQQAEMTKRKGALPPFFIELLALARCFFGMRVFL